MLLSELQRAFQARILTRGKGIEGELKGTGNGDFASRLDVYVEGYRARLVEVLGTTYPVLMEALGGSEFERQMREYVDSTPSRHYSVRYYGASVAEHVDAGDGDVTGEALGELARWEWLLAEVFDAADDEPLGIAALAEVPGASWPALSFAFRAPVRRIETRTNIVEWWRAANGLCASPETLAAATPSQWLLWRRGVKTYFRSLDGVEAMAFDLIRGGATFGALCESLAQCMEESAVPLYAASLLRGWMTEELIATFTRADGAG